MVELGADSFSGVVRALPRVESVPESAMRTSETDWDELQRAPWSGSMPKEGMAELMVKHSLLAWRSLLHSVSVGGTISVRRHSDLTRSTHNPTHTNTAHTKDVPLGSFGTGDGIDPPPRRTARQSGSGSRWLVLAAEGLQPLTSLDRLMR